MCSFSCAVLLSTNCLQQSESIGLRPTCSSVRKRFKAGRERRERGEREERERRERRERGAREEREEKERRERRERRERGAPPCLGQPY
jgi:hypothetical protein